MSLIQTEPLRGRIAEILNQPMSGAVLGNTLFSPNGLFNRLAQTEAERRVLAQSNLFKQAMDRYMELKDIDAARLRHVIGFDQEK